MTTIKRLVFGDSRDPREELAEIFGEPVQGPGPQPAAMAWARRTVSDQGVDAQDEVLVIKTLRDHEDRLGLKTAQYLASCLATQG